MADLRLRTADLTFALEIRNPQSAIRNRAGSDVRLLARARYSHRDRQRRRRSAAGGAERGTRAGCASSRRRDHSPRRLRPQPAEHSAGGSRGARGGRWARELRSEEHTSELQSQSNLVCRLLLEKKKKK